MLKGKTFEQLKVGDKFITLARTITEPDIVDFVNLAGLTEELFTNIEYIMKESVFKQRIAPGALTFSFAEGLTMQTGLLHRTGLALLGMTMRVVAPVRCNDTLHVEVEVTDKRETGNGERGVVGFKHTVLNQENQPVMVYDITRMIKRQAQ